MEAVLARALAWDPSSRFASTDKLLVSFKRVSAGKRARQWSRSRSGEFLASVLQRMSPRDLALNDHPINRLSAPRCSINYGGAGISWFLYRTACMRDDPRLLAAADVWCTRARLLASDEAAFTSSEIGITREATGGISPFHSLSGIHLVQAHVSRAMGDIDSARQAARAFTKACTEPCDNPDLTLGWTSVLLGCAALTELLRQPGTSDQDPVFALGRRFAARIGDWMAERHIVDTHDLRWLGFAHGWAGLLFGLLRWTEASGDPFPSIARKRLHDLATFGQRQGEAIRWPRELGNDASGRDSSTGWCHGSAGYLLLWTLAHRLLGDDSFLALARGSAIHIAVSIHSDSAMDANLSSLCCGYAGQGFALMALHRATGEAESLRLAGELCERAVQFASNTTRPDSLYKGDVGIALLIQEFTQPLRASMPLVEAEGW
jgi:serine/threonine-protein kinase